MKTSYTGRILLRKADTIRLREIRAFIESNLDKDLTIQFIADTFSVSAMTLRRHFILYYHMPVYNFVLRCRMKKAKELILDGNYTLNELSIIVGYRRYTSFLHAFLKYYHVAPSFFKTFSLVIVNEQKELLNEQN